MNYWISVDFFQHRTEIFIQSEKMDQKRFFNPLVENDISFLPEGENAIRGMNDVGIQDLGKPEKLSAFQGLSK
jgi:hypothetical protein